MPQNQPASPDPSKPFNPAPKAKPVKYPKPKGPEAPPTPSWIGKKTYAQSLDGRWLFELIARTVSVAVLEALEDLEDELLIHA